MEYMSRKLQQTYLTPLCAHRPHMCGVCFDGVVFAACFPPAAGSISVSQQQSLISKNKSQFHPKTFHRRSQLPIVDSFPAFLLSVQKGRQTWAIGGARRLGETSLLRDAGLAPLEYGAVSSLLRGTAERGHGTEREGGHGSEMAQSVQLRPATKKPVIKKLRFVFFFKTKFGAKEMELKLWPDTNSHISSIRCEIHPNKSWEMD